MDKELDSINIPISIKIITITTKGNGKLTNGQRTSTHKREREIALLALQFDMNTLHLPLQDASKQNCIAFVLKKCNGKCWIHGVSLFVCLFGKRGALSV